jgi:RNA polymerase sigma factor (sigma-70 family)
VDSSSASPTPRTPLPDERPTAFAGKDALPDERLIDLALVERYRAGGEDGQRAAGELVRRHAKWCRETARKWAKRPHDLDDYVQACHMAIFDAIPTWVPEKGGLRTHAIWLLRDALREVHVGLRVVRVPYGLLERMRRAYKLGIPTTPSAMKEAGILSPTAEVEDGDLLGHGTSLDAHISDFCRDGNVDDRITFGDNLVDKQVDTEGAVAHDERLARVLKLAREVLTDNRYVVFVRCLNGESEQEIADDLGRTRAAISLRWVTSVKLICRAAKKRGWAR